MRILLGLLKFITGFSLAIAIIAASGFYGVRYVMTRLTAPPERPVFRDETASLDSGSAAPLDSEGGSEGGTAATDEATANGANESNAPIEAAPALEPGAYEARVVQPIGLILRQGPDISTTQLGGIAYNEVVVVLAESTDQKWLKVRLPDSDVEGWVKNGNTESLN